MVRRFFLDYKKLEGKQVQVEKIEPAKKAYPFIEDAVARYAKKMKPRNRRRKLNKSTVILSDAIDQKSARREMTAAEDFREREKSRIMRSRLDICSMRAGWSPKRAD
jgi:hypothetical protein